MGQKVSIWRLISKNGIKIMGKGKSGGLAPKLCYEKCLIINASIKTEMACNQEIRNRENCALTLKKLLGTTV